MSVFGHKELSKIFGPEKTEINDMDKELSDTYYS
jgi:hypothetical protein